MRDACYRHDNGNSAGPRIDDPATGRGTREYLSDKAREAQARAAEAAEKGREALTQGRDTLATALERGREAYQQARGRDEA